METGTGRSDCEEDMIRNGSEYQQAVQRLREESKRIAKLKQELKAKGLKPEELKRAIDPIYSFHLQLKEEVESYERLKRGDFDEIKNLHGLGRTLVALRIASGLTQRELAEKLGVHESQVSRDERNEYHGITVERASHILDELNAEMHSEINLQTLSKD